MVQVDDHYNSGSNSDLEKNHDPGHHVVDEKAVAAPAFAVGAAVGQHSTDKGTLKRQLKNRHIAMISIGGVIGTGLFIGSGGALTKGGPLGLLLGYSVMGTIVWAVMICLGEMVSHLPIAGGHISLATRFADPALAFTMGWNYWYNWTIVLPAELSAAALLVEFWTDRINAAAWITIFLVITVAINLGGARAYGEMEFWFASIKVITIVGLIILGIIIDAGGGPDHRPIGFQYWRNPGPFVQFHGIQGAKGRFLGFWAVLIQAGFSYIGTEITAIAAGEARNPKRNLPKAIKRVYVRIALFYILGVFIIGLLVPFNEDRLVTDGGTPKGSPFVIAIERSGIKTLPSIVNACFLTSAWSAASSDMYTSSRALYSMALGGGAPKILRRTNSWGLPYICVGVAVAFSLLSYMAAGSAGASKVFGWFANMTSVAGLLTWCGIFVTYLRWWKGCKAQSHTINRNELPFKAPCQPYAAYYGLVMCSLILFFNGFAVFLHHEWDNATFITSYLPLALFFILYSGYKLINRTSWIPPDEMDFVTGSRDVEEEDEPPPKNFAEKFWRWLM